MLYVLVTLARGIGQDGASLKDQFCVYCIAGVYSHCKLPYKATENILLN